MALSLVCTVLLATKGRYVGEALRTVWIDPGSCSGPFLGKVFTRGRPGGNGEDRTTAKTNCSDLRVKRILRPHTQGKAHKYRALLTAAAGRRELQVLLIPTPSGWASFRVLLLLTLAPLQFVSSLGASSSFSDLRHANSFAKERLLTANLFPDWVYDRRRQHTCHEKAPDG